MDDLTQKRLKELLHYEPETGMFIRLVATSNVKAGSVAGGIDKTLGYRKIYAGGKQYLASRLAFLYMTGKWPTKQMDHINHVRNDDRWINLREVSHKENGRNVSPRDGTKAGVTGVCWYQSSNKWGARICVDGKQVHLGLFDTIDNASTARKSAVIEYGFHPNHGNQTPLEAQHES